VKDAFAVQDEIVHAIVGALQVKLTGAASVPLAKASTASPEAHDLYLQGRYFFAKRDSASLLKAQDYFARAIANDPSYALAYAGLGETYSHRAIFGHIAPRDVLDKAKAALVRALALDSTLVQAHTALAFMALVFEWDWATAKREFDKALALDPRYPPVHLYHAWYLLATGKTNDAVEELRTAVRLDPFDIITNTRLASMLFYARRYDEELSQIRRVREMDSTFFQVPVELARAYLQLGRCAEAVAALRQGPEVPTRIPILQGVPGWTYARCGHRAQAMAQLDRFRLDARAGRYVSHYPRAVIYAGLGDTERVFAELDSAYADRAAAMFVIALDPTFDGLRADPRFVGLLKKVRPVR
jgi:tetratricopeptide (TPR) repeat protein